MKIKLKTLKRILREALDPNACADCMGSGEYVGFNSVDKCKACGGSGKKPMGRSSPVGVPLVVFAAAKQAAARLTSAMKDDSGVDVDQTELANCLLADLRNNNGKGMTEEEIEMFAEGETGDPAVDALRARFPKTQELFNTYF